MSCSSNLKAVAQDSSTDRRKFRLQLSPNAQWHRDPGKLYKSGDHFSPDCDGEETKVADTVVADAAVDKKDKHVAGDKDPPGDVPAEDKASEPDEGPWLPDRVKKALEKSQNFDEFRKSRPFRFLHLLSGEKKDQLGKLIRKEARKARLDTYIESLDRKKDAELNLADPKMYDQIEKSIGDGEWDRSAAHIYGLPGNTPSQQREADEGALMATR